MCTLLCLALQDLVSPHIAQIMQKVVQSFDPHILHSILERLFVLTLLLNPPQILKR